MKSKLLVVIIALLFAGSAYCQIPEVMVGDTEMIGKYIQWPTQPPEEYCGSGDLWFVRHSDNDFSYIIKTGIKRIPDTQSYGHDRDTLFVSLVCKSQSVHIDSTVFFSIWSCGATGHNIWSFRDSVYRVFTAKGIDSIVAIKIKDTSIILPLDTQANKYKSKIEPFYFYSNIADKVLFDSWQLVVDPSAKINFTVDSNSNALSEYTSKPFTRKKQLNFTFASALAATDTAHSFPATIKTHIRYKGVDSIYSNNFTIILPAAPKSDVRNSISPDISFTISPNPFSKATTFIVTTPNSEPFTLEIYDLLGNRKAIIANDEHIDGVHDFHFEASGLGEGSYFVRLMCRTQVITRKLIFEK